MSTTNIKDDTTLETIKPSAALEALRQHLITPDQNSQTIRDNVHKALKNYFQHLDGQPVTDVYQMVLSEVEAPLLETVMDYTVAIKPRRPSSSGSTVAPLRKTQDHGLI